MATPPSAWTEPTAVYWLHDAGGSLLYIGVSVSPRTRVQTHQRDMPWGGEIDPSRTVVEWFKDRPAALESEAQAIAAHAPPHNCTGTDRQPRSRHERESMPYDNLRRVRIDKQLWDALGALVGGRNRSAVIRDYMTWRIENPTTPLPGCWRGPVKKVRKRKQP